MRLALRILACCLLAATVCGCTGIAGPNWCTSGPARDQRAKANFHDPYPDREAGPPIADARPREFDRPFAQPLSSQLERWCAPRSQAGP